MNSTFERYVERVREDFAVPGIAVAIVEDDTLVLAKGYGVRRLAEQQPLTEHSLFGIASISKSFTAMALGMLVDEGKLKWNDPVTKYIPSFQLHDAYATRELTVLDLLVHRSGLAPVSGGSVWYGSEYGRDQVVERIRYLRPVSSFRSEFAYQNILYLVAGQIIPALTGQSWDAFVKERIFGPLGMRRSNTSILDFDPVSDVAQPHVLVDGKLQVVAHRNYDNAGPAASINCSALELAAYVRLLLNGGRFEDKQLYGAKIAEDLWTPHMLIPAEKEAIPALEPFNPQLFHAYALGWFIQDFRGQRRVSHAGGIDGLRSLLTMIPDRNLGIVVFANHEGPADWILTTILLELYGGASEIDWYETAVVEWRQHLEKQAVNLEASRVPDTRPSLDLELYGGGYESQVYGVIEVAFAEGALELHFTHSASFKARLTHWHHDTFRIDWHDPVVPDGLLTFVLDGQGHVVELRFEQRSLLDFDFSELHPIKRREQRADNLCLLR
jgi:CubicO group peptidase (beta-lactamase class C family)